MYYFAYGSNMQNDRLKKRVGKMGLINDCGVGRVSGYKLKFNKQSVDGTGKANIVAYPDFEVCGVVYDLTEPQMLLLDENEKGYARKKMVVALGTEKHEMWVYIANTDSLNEALLPTRDYLYYLIQGAKEHDFSMDYMDFLQSFACKS